MSSQGAMWWRCIERYRHEERVVATGLVVRSSSYPIMRFSLRACAPYDILLYSIEGREANVDT